MTDNNTPTLKFDVAAAVQETGEGIAQLAQEVQQEAAVEPVITEFEHSPELEGADLSAEEIKNIEAFVEKINISDADNVLLYGSDAQKRIAEFSDAAMATIKNKDSGEVGNMLVDLIGKLKGFNSDSEEPQGIKRLFFNATKHIEGMKHRYESVQSNVEQIANSLENHQVALLKDIAMLDELYDTNTKYFKELTMYIMAGQKKLKLVRETDLKQLREEASASGDPMLAQRANDLAQLCDRFEKKIHDLKLTRQVSLQMAPQIRLLQNNDSLLVERIQSTLSNTLPLWKSQMVLALGLHRSQQALKAQTEVTNMTNELLKKNADKLKMGTVQTAREAERGIVDIKTLVHTNQSLIDTITEVMKIQEEGHSQRVEAEKELIRMEQELKKKLLEIKK